MDSNASPASYLWPNWLTILLAIWLFISPWALAAEARGAWAWNFWVVSIVMAVLSIAALSRVAEWEDWVNLALGAWLFISPWIFGYTALVQPAWNSYIVGLLVVLISIWGIAAAHTHISRASSAGTE